MRQRRTWSRRAEARAMLVRNGECSLQQLLGRALHLEREHALVLLDPDGCVVGWLAGATQVFGFDAAEMAGCTLERIFTPEDLEHRALDWQLRAAEAYGKCEDDRWHVRKDGVRFWASGVVTALRDESGDLLGYSKVLRDRTDVRSQVETLQARLETSSRVEHEKHVLLGTLAHELRSPLGPLSNAAEVIRRLAPEKPQIASSLQIIDRQVKFIGNVVSDLLESTRTGVGKAELHYQHLDVAELVRKAVETCSAMLAEREQMAEVLLSSGLALDADPIRLQQVLVNIVGNSSKFSPAGSRIYIKGTVEADEVVLRVEDNGRGIPAVLLPRIFDLFTQANEEGGRPEHGLGLGLGIVKNIVELHRGTVQARSEGTGRGTEIIVRLPMKRPHLPAST